MSRDATLQKWLKDLPQKPGKQELPPPKPRNRKKRISIYDFDGTLFNSPDRERGETLLFEATGELWPHQGWWGRAESLLPPIVPEKPGEEWFVAPTVEAYREDAKDEHTELILMTGRPYRLRWRVQQILDHHGIAFHDYRYRGMKGQKGRNTFEIKTNIIELELVHPALEILEIWEDRPEHTSDFLTLARRWKAKYRDHLRKVVIHDVMTGQHHTIGE